VFAKYGNVERVNLLKTMAGDSMGAAFIVFEKKEEAEASLELDKTKLKSKVLTVEISKDKNYKRTATTRGKDSSLSPALGADGDSAMSPSPAPDFNGANAHSLRGPPTHTDSAARTMTVINIPDTVNDARVRALAEPFGEIVKLVLRPDHQGAIIEYADVAAAGRASLGLEGQEIAAGRKLRTGGLKELFGEKDEVKTDRIQVGQGKKTPATFIKPNMPVRRPGPAGRGGLGSQRRGLGYTAPMKDAPSGTPGRGEANGTTNENKALKSNADFKAMFLGAGKE